MSRRRNRGRSLRINTTPDVDSESHVSSTTDAEPRRVKPLIIKRTWTKIESPQAGSPPTLVLRSIPGGNQGSRKYNLEVAKLLLRLNTSASTKGDDPTEPGAVTSSSKDTDTEMSSDLDVDENFLAVSNDEDSEMTESETGDEKGQSPAHPSPPVGLCDTCLGSPNLYNPGSASPMQLFKCRSCGGDFSRRGNLVINLSPQSSNRLLECSFDTCDKSFRSTAALRAHERHHAYQLSAPRDEENNLRVSPASGCGNRIALRIFKARRGTPPGAQSPLSSRWNSTDLCRTPIHGYSSPSPQPLHYQ